jgi:hypothetical protein
MRQGLPYPRLPAPVRRAHHNLGKRRCGTPVQSRRVERDRQALAHVRPRQSAVRRGDAHRVLVRRWPANHEGISQLVTVACRWLADLQASRAQCSWLRPAAPRQFKDRVWPARRATISQHLGQLSNRVLRWCEAIYKRRTRCVTLDSLFPNDRSRANWAAAASDWQWPLWRALHNGHYVQSPIMCSWGG